PATPPRSRPTSPTSSRSRRRSRRAASSSSPTRTSTRGMRRSTAHRLGSSARTTSSAASSCPQARIGSASSTGRTAWGPVPSGASSDGASLRSSHGERDVTRGRVYALGLAALVAPVWWLHLTSPDDVRSLRTADLAGYFVPGYAAFYGWLARGVWLRWNPFQACGFPW